MKIQKVIFVASECQPFIASGGLGDVIGSLPSEIVKASKKEIQVSVILPLYSKINSDFRNKLVYVGQIFVKLAWRRSYCGIFKYTNNGVNYYFIDNEYYFKRTNIYGYFDDAERFAFFSKAAIEVIAYLNEEPDIIHVHDWQTGLIPIYLRTLYYNDERFKEVKTVFTIHNIEYQGIYSLDADIIEDVFGISYHDSYLLEYQKNLNIMKGAMEASNMVTTVSYTYSQEIMYPEFAHSLEYETKRINDEGKLYGILNGIDKTFYNPEKDGALFANYSAKDITNKQVNKEELQKMLNLPVDNNVLLIGMVTRLVSHKGLDLLRDCIERLLKEPVQFIALGTGDSYFEGMLNDYAYKNPTKMRVILAYNQDMSRKIYGASDLFLMPSKSEPCGLSQMIACRYGTIPLVRKTGGLADSIKDLSSSDGFGYVFNDYCSDALLATVRRAIEDYQNKDEWTKNVIKAMKINFGWSNSAKEYIKLYQKLK